MRHRTIFKLLLFVLIGAIINVAVAWGLTAIRRTTSPSYSQRINYHFKESTSQWVVILLRHAGVERAVWMAIPSSANGYGIDVIPETGVMLDEHHPPLWTSMNWHTAPAESDIGWMQIEVASGWPRYSLASWTLMDDPMNESTGILLDADSDSPWLLRSLPLRPIWPGFAINTIFYAAIVWGLFAVPGAIRRHVRRKRGQCAKCAYSLQGITGLTCPECGEANQSRARQEAAA